MPVIRLIFIKKERKINLEKLSAIKLAIKDV